MGQHPPWHCNLHMGLAELPSASTVLYRKLGPIKSPVFSPSVTKVQTWHHGSQAGAAHTFLAFHLLISIHYSSLHVHISRVYPWAEGGTRKLYGQPSSLQIVPPPYARDHPF